MGKRGRNTAKTGDKALYKNRTNFEEAAKRNLAINLANDQNDHLYTAVDRFHNQREQDFLKLDGATDNDDDDANDVNNIDAVMNLAAGGDGSDDDNEDESDSDDYDNDTSDVDNNVSNNNQKTGNKDGYSSSSDDEVSVTSSNDDIFDNDNDNNNIRSWGTKKSSYYDGDTPDSTSKDKDNDNDDAQLEEIAAKEVQASRLKDMSEDDFIVSDDDDDDDGENDSSDDDDNEHNDEQINKIPNSSSRTAVVNKQHNATKKVSKIKKSDKLIKLSIKEKRKIIEKQHPEMLPLISHFTDIVQDLQSNTLIATNAIFDNNNNSNNDVTTAEVRNA
jgi:hypothetical protein